MALNQTYDCMWLYDNCFQPVMRLQPKELLPNANGDHQVRHRFDQAQTPLDRLAPAPFDLDERLGWTCRPIITSGALPHPA